MNVAIVNDSKVAAEVLRRILAEMPEFHLLWTAYSGEEAVRLSAAARPDIILMDLIMPGIGGAETTRRIMQSTPCVILVVTATTVGNRDHVFEAMGYGALDAVNTPRLGPDGDMSGAEPLRQKLRTVARLVNHQAASHRADPTPSNTTQPNPAQPSSAQPTSFQSRPVPTQLRSAPCPPIVAIGASTGGPQALSVILSNLPAHFPAAILVAQHVDEQFAPGLATWLQHYSPLPVRIARNGEPLTPGGVWIAGASGHLIYENDGVRGCFLGYTPNPRDSAYRPSVDALFASLAHPHSVAHIGVLLTGMGRDGAEGLLALRNAGGLTIAQDAASSIVYGMPKAAAELKAAAEILPLESIGPRIRNAILAKTLAQPPLATHP
ncbi:MAG: chemotaxis-specific protein-glutamate methyltransferase CheB [Terracidiphilus sp.]|jgi:two-component system response regulator WspF